MASLPTPGGDPDTWGAELNEYLLAAHTADGTPKEIFPVAPVASDNAAAINAAIDAADDVNGTVLLLPSASDIETSGGHVVPEGVTVDLNGQTVKHTGDNLCFKVTNAGAPDFKPRRSALGNGWLKGNAGASARGVEVADGWGTWLWRLRIGSAENAADRYSHANGVGLTIHNETAWCEGIRCEDVFLISNKTNLRFKRTSGSGGTNSLAYCDFKNIAIQCAAACTGIDMGIAGDDMLLYNALLDARIWLEGDNAVGVDVGASFKVPGTTLAFIRGESFGGTGRVTMRNRGGTFIPRGYVDWWQTGATVDLAAGKTLLGPRLVGRGYADTAVRPTLAGSSTPTDMPDIGHAGIGFVHQANEEYPVGWGYGGGGAGRRILSWAAKPFSSDTGGATDTAANERMGLDTDGLLSLFGSGAGLAIKEGANQRMGVATLVSGTVTVSNTKVTANSRIFLMCQTPGGTPGFLRVSARVAGTSFTITSSSGSDTSTVAWLIVEPS